MSSELLQIGAVCRPHGLRGELRVRLHDPASQALDGLRRLWLGADAGDMISEEGQLRECRVRSARRLEDGFYLLILDGVSDRNGAEALRAQRLYARRSELPALEEDEVYVADMIGCQVVDREGLAIGVAKEVQDIGGRSLLLVERLNRAPALVPLVPQILLEVDLLARVIRVDPPEGLLDLDGDVISADLSEAERWA